MNKFIPLSLVALLFLGSPVFALFCSKCGVEAKEDASFCSKCGTKIDSNNASTTSGNSSQENLSIDDLLSPVKEFETFITSSNFITCIAKVPEFKIKFEEYEKKFNAISSKASTVAKKKFDLSKKKFVLLQLLMEAWSRKINGPLKVTAEATMAKLAFALESYNSMIAELKDETSIQTVKQMEKDLEFNMKDYKVTSKFLKVENCWIAKDQPVWVAKVEKDRVRVVHMGEPDLAFPIAGWVSIEEMKKRTTWQQK